MQEAAVGVEEGGEAADEGGADLVGAEGDGANEADGREAAEVHGDFAAWVRVSTSLLGLGAMV